MPNQKPEPGNGAAVRLRERLAATPPPALGRRVRLLRGTLRTALGMANFVHRVTGGAAGTGVADDAVGLDAAHGPVVSRDDAPLLFSLLEHLDRKMGGVRPQEVRLGALPACAAADLPPEAGGGQALLLGLPCLSAWTVDEFSAVVAHELAHLKLEDAAFTRQALRTSQRLRGARGPRQLLGRWSGRAAARVCRELELRADRWAATVCRPAVLRSALEKLEVAKPLFLALLEDFDGEPADANVFAAFAKTWDGLSPERIAGLAAKFSRGEAADPLDLHPPLAARLAALRELEAADPAPPARSAPATALLKDAGVFARMLHSRLYRGSGSAKSSVFFPESEG